MKKIKSCFTLAICTMMFICILAVVAGWQPSAWMWEEIGVQDRPMSQQEKDEFQENPYLTYLWLEDAKFILYALGGIALFVSIRHLMSIPKFREVEREQVEKDKYHQGSLEECQRYKYSELAKRNDKKEPHTVSMSMPRYDLAGREIKGSRIECGSYSIHTPLEEQGQDDWLG